MSRRKSSLKARRSRRRRRLIALVLAAALGGVAWLVWPFWQMSDQFAERPITQPSRLYGEAVLLETGRSVDVAWLAEELLHTGYQRVTDSQPARGQFSLDGGSLRLQLRSYPTPWGWNSGGPLQVRFSGQRIASLEWRGQTIDRIRLEPPLLRSYYGSDRQERRPVRLEEVSSDLVQAVLAAEDSRFFQHQGLSLRGILRAAWVNLQGGAVLQGGSTLTQQLVKNLFLSRERTVMRKLREALLALLIDWRYDKEEILSAYLNEIYWGSSDGVNLMGVGAAAWAYFGKEAPLLTLCESAVLAGMISSPGGFSPIGQPERAKTRRDWVLGRMAELGWLEESRLDSARSEPLCVSPRTATARKAPHFGDRAAVEARDRFGVKELEDRGYVLLSTLRRRDQEMAEAAVAWGLEALERGWEAAGPDRGPLQAALVSLDPRSGAIRSYVGGRDYRESQFDRAGQAMRQAGSAFKPVVYAAALEDRRVGPSTLLEDAPLTVALAGRSWSPENADSSFRGWVTVRRALEESLNVPTARLALSVGLDRIVRIAREMGIQGRLEPVPALALGAFEVSPVELAAVYAVLASGGVRSEVHGLEAVLGPQGRPIEGRDLAAPRRVLSPPTVFIMTSMLQGVLDRGTARSVRAQGLLDSLAGKTGTTNERRDSWFAGYSPDRVSLVWVGYDDNSPTHLSGARAALPIWARFTWKVRPRGGYPIFDQPAGVATAVIDPSSGGLATDDCPEVLTEVFVQGAVPTEVCPIHGDRWREAVWPPTATQEPPRKGRWRWLKRLFGRDDSGQPSGPPE